MAYQAYLFDLDGTLYSRDALVEKILTLQYREFESALGHIGAEQYISRVIVLDQHGYRPKDQVYRQVAEEFDLTETLTAKLMDHFWSSYDGNIDLPDDTALTLKSLKDHGARLGVITNGQTVRQKNKLRALGISNYFDVVLISEAEGLKKPAHEIFTRAMERLQIEPHDVVFIGDHPTADIDGARNAGLAAIWKRTPYWEMNRSDVRVIDNLIEILD